MKKTMPWMNLKDDDDKEKEDEDPNNDDDGCVGCSTKETVPWGRRPP